MLRRQRSVGQVFDLTCVAAVLLLTVGCQTQSRTVTEVKVASPQEGSDAPQRAVIEAPADLHDLSGFLLRYQVEHGRYPDRLEDLRTAGIMPNDGFAQVNQYAYNRNGLGRLDDGSLIMVVDRTIRLADHVWCILQIVEPGQHTAALDVRLVPWPDLQAAAKRSR